MLHFCIELNIIGPVDKNARFDERPIARIFIVNNDWVLLNIQRVGIHWVYFGGVWFTLVLLRSGHWDLVKVKTVLVDKVFGGHQVGSIAFKRTTSSEVECFVWVSVKITSEVILQDCTLIKNMIWETWFVQDPQIFVQSSFTWIQMKYCDSWMIIWMGKVRNLQSGESLFTNSIARYK